MLLCHKVAIDTQQYVYTHTSRPGKTLHKSTLTIILQLDKINISCIINRFNRLQFDNHLHVIREIDSYYHHLIFYLYNPQY